MLRPETPADLIAIEDDLAEIVSECRKMRQKMQEMGLESVELENDKARGFVKYLKEEWMTTSAGRVQKAAIKQQAKRAFASKKDARGKAK